MKKIKKHRGIEELKSRYGLMFILPWIIGIVLFFFYPIIQSIIYSFSSVVNTSDGILTEFVGLKHYIYILDEDPDYTNWISEAITNFLYSFPIIILLSLVIAMMLNQEFRGRLFFRALYFLPVIIATGAVIKFVFQQSSSNLTDAGVSDSFSASMLNISDLTTYLDMDPKIADLITNIINRIFDLVWSCGIQIVLYLAGLQSVPRTLYEASKVEGATKWEEFWFITFPMLSRVTLLVGVFTMVEQILDENSVFIERTFGKIQGGTFDEPSAKLWFYFIIMGAIMGVIVLLYNRLLMKRWEA